jgi:deoxyribonuclease V
MTRDELIREQERIGTLQPPVWSPPVGSLTMAGCFVAFQRGIAGKGRRGDRCWAAAVASRNRLPIGHAVVAGDAEAPYEPGLLFLREGPLLLSALRGLPGLLDVLLVNATGRDHPRRAGLAVHIGALLDLPTIGVTDRPLCAEGEEPSPEVGSVASLHLAGEPVGFRLRPRPGVRPVTVHAAWRTDPATALAVARIAIRRARTPEPIRLARQLARRART